MKSRSNLSKEEVNGIIRKCEVCVVGMVDGENGPYVLPFNFGFRDNRLYIHSGPEGKKIELWEKDPRVCVSFSTDYQMRIQNENVACSYSMRYKSVLLYGAVKQIENLEEKEQALNIIMEKYSGRSNFSYSKPALQNVSVFVIVPEKIESRSYGY
ncbi:MAG TPA: pyridoxamine 5'-phosphate oxidase family protein [Tenuifilaceae bacterium]|nr:pyridoxamine 5'-phosphate oxidase family protein [Tenuifilaceae bacterium]HPE17153.1 pyridoxamine 5'-phosphate oxidase family protein [Tenuifilaceae bacterium]HPJ45881.1 pyridoxamine 5'-phosphate oxidase family protein [Tenuifilaceae bacterium]HPQ34088.1 pyridoxamine 5'-phosphate oxidase family protein [Tenuifilaceae bacterium]HRX68741.1 pyridoxamine 5'-phosphate oxidase family protein [Tenuifilaceae bacterium]